MTEPDHNDKESPAPTAEEQHEAGDLGTAIAAVAAIYQAERTDSSTILTTIVALVTAGAAYLVGTIALWDKFSLLKGWIVVLPFPLVCVSSFHALLISVAIVKTKSLLTLEARLKNSARIFDELERANVGALAVERIVNLQRAVRWEYKANLLLTYGGEGAIILGYAIAILAQSVTFIGAWAIVPAIAYIGMFALVARLWILVTTAAGEIRT